MKKSDDDLCGRESREPCHLGTRPSGLLADGAKG